MSDVESGRSSEERGGRLKTDRDCNPPYNIMISGKFPIYKVLGILSSGFAIQDIDRRIL